MSGSRLEVVLLAQNSGVRDLQAVCQQKLMQTFVVLSRHTRRVPSAPWRCKVKRCIGKHIEAHTVCGSSFDHLQNYGGWGWAKVGVFAP